MMHRLVFAGVLLGGTLSLSLPQGVQAEALEPAELAVTAPVMAADAPAPAATLVNADSASVWVPVADLKAGSVIAAGDLVEKTLPKRQVSTGMIASVEAAVGKQLTRDAEAGKPLLKMRLKEVVDVSRDSMVALVFRRPGMTLNGTGRALQDGKIGDSVRVLNPDSRTTLVATVTAPGEVEVR